MDGRYASHGVASINGVDLAALQLATLAAV
jgi:hypothetical protein